MPSVICYKSTSQQSPLSPAGSTFSVATTADELNLLVRENVSVASSGASFCHLCRTVLKSKASVRRHFQDMHYDDGTVFQCPKCDSRTFGSKYRLRNHIYEKHRELSGMDLEKFRVHAYN